MIVHLRIDSGIPACKKSISFQHRKDFTIDHSLKSMILWTVPIDHIATWICVLYVSNIVGIAVADRRAMISPFCPTWRARAPRGSASTQIDIGGNRSLADLPTRMDVIETRESRRFLSSHTSLLEAVADNTNPRDAIPRFSGIFTFAPGATHHLVEQ